MVEKWKQWVVVRKVLVAISNLVEINQKHINRKSKIHAPCAREMMPRRDVAQWWWMRDNKTFKTCTFHRQKGAHNREPRCEVPSRLARSKRQRERDHFLVLCLAIFVLKAFFIVYNFFRFRLYFREYKIIIYVQIIRRYSRENWIYWSRSSFYDQSF